MAGGETGPAHNLGRCHLSGSGESAAEAPVPWFPRRKRRSGQRLSGPRGHGRLAMGPWSRRARVPRPPRVPDPARPYPEPGSQASKLRVGAGPERTAGSREAAASARRPAQSFYLSGRWPPPARYLHTDRPPPAVAGLRGLRPYWGTAESGRCPSGLDKDPKDPPRGALVLAGCWGDQTESPAPPRCRADGTEDDRE